MIHKSVNALPFYNRLEHQNRFKDNVQNGCGYKLISPNDKFLNFQFLCLDKNVTIAKIELCFDKYNKVDLTHNKNKLDIISKDNGTYIQYLGEPLIFKAQTGEVALVLDSTPQWLEITLSNGDTAYSEVFYPVSDLNKYLKVEYWTNGDLFPILYSNGFKQQIYIDSFIHAQEPEIEEETQETAAKKIIPISQTMISNYKINIVVPDFLKLAFTSLQLHRDIHIDTIDRLEFIRANRVTVTSTIESNGEQSRVELSIRQILLTLSACNAKIN